MLYLACSNVFSIYFFGIENATPCHRPLQAASKQCLYIDLAKVPSRRKLIRLRKTFFVTKDIVSQIRVTRKFVNREENIFCNWPTESDIYLPVSTIVRLKELGHW